MRSCLESLRALTIKPDSVLIVDSSSDSDTRDLVMAYQNGSMLPDLKLVRSDAKGLVSARNVALRLLENSTEIIHFADDDVEFLEGYFERIQEIFAFEDDVVGVGGVTLGAADPTRNIILDFFGLTSKRPGQLLRTGIASPTFVERSETREVSWLPGCSMSFRASAVKGMKFDQNRTDLPLGEDVDFTARLGMRGKLVHNHRARLVHNMSPVNRDEVKDMFRQDVIHRWTLAEQGIGGVTKIGVIYGTLAVAGVQLVSSVVRGSKAALDNFSFTLIGLAQVLRWGGLNANKGRHSR